MKTCDIIGISDSRQQWFPPEVMDIIKSGSVFSGGKRHHEIMAPWLPDGAIWIDISIPLEKVFEQYEQHEHVIVFASGDPLFFGFANTLQRKCQDVKMQIFPTFNSLQMLAHRMSVAYHDMHVVSLTGRPWQKLDEAPHAIHQRMVEYGYTNYLMMVGENLGNEELERVSRYDEQTIYSHPNCIILQKTSQRVRPFGIPDSAFSLLDGREKMITKMPIRLFTLQALNLPHRHVLWDIGFCTGSISIEARLQFPHLQIEAFEIRPECETIIHENARRFGAPGINVHIGNFLEADIASIPRPDAVFIGGHGGQLKEIIKKVLTVLTDDGCIVMNSVKAPKVLTDSHQLWDEACEELGLKQDAPTKIILNENHPIEILTCSK